MLLSGDVDVGISIELLESKSDKWILNGWSLDAYGSDNRLGVGVAKDLYENKLFEIDAGVYATKEFKNFFKNPINVNIGISGCYKF